MDFVLTDREKQDLFIDDDEVSLLYDKKNKRFEYNLFGSTDKNMSLSIPADVKKFRAENPNNSTCIKLVNSFDGDEN